MTTSRLLRDLAVVCMCLTAGVGVHGQTGALKGEWHAYGGDTGHTRYAPLDQINADNFCKLTIAWRFKTDHLGPRPEFMFESTPVMANGVLYSTAGSRRAVVALDPETGEELWMHSEREGARGVGGAAPAFGPRPGLLDRRQRGAHPLCHARLSARRAEREDRHARAGVRRRRHRRSEAEQRSADRSACRARSACTPHRWWPATSSSSARRTARAACRPARRTSRATSAASTCERASACGFSTPFRRRASSATRRG